MGAELRLGRGTGLARMTMLSVDERQALLYIAEEMPGLVFDDAVLERLVELGLAAPDAGTWVLTETGQTRLAEDVPS